jgi:hypothetical protein
MKERELNLNRNGDSTIVIDTEGKLAKKLEKIYQNINLNLGFCYEQLKAGKLTVGMKETHLVLAEKYLLDFLTECGYDGILEKQKNERYTEIRSLNEENRNLRKQLGEKVSNEDVREKVKIIHDNFNRWWSENGFGHTSEFYITNYAARAKLSGMVFESRYKENNTEERKSQYLNKLGFEIEDKHIILNDASAKLLEALLISKFPSVDIIQIETYMRNGILTMKEIHIAIADLDEL